jgi:hypothetical protein
MNGRAEPFDQELALVPFGGAFGAPALGRVEPDEPDRLTGAVSPSTTVIARGSTGWARVAAAGSG